MALPCLFLALLLLGRDTAVDDDVCLVQVTTKVNGAHSAISSFLSHDVDICFAGPAGLAEPTLATKLVGPYAAVLNAAAIRPGVQCKCRGYAVPVGEDDCYPGLQVDKKRELGMLCYRLGKAVALNPLGQRCKLNNCVVELTTGCTRHAKCALRGLMKTNCCRVETLPASWGRKDPAAYLLSCVQGNFESAACAVAVVDNLLYLPTHRTDLAALPLVAKDSPPGVAFLAEYLDVVGRILDRCSTP